MEIRTLNPDDIPETIYILEHELASAIMIRLGRRFLQSLFASSMTTKHSFTLVALEKTKVVGVALVIIDKKKWLKDLLTRHPNVIGIITVNIMRQPRLLIEIVKQLQLAQTLPQEAELVCLAVERNFQRQGMGRKLLHAVKRECQRRDVDKISIGIQPDMRTAEKFYRQNQAVYAGTFTSFGKKLVYFSYDTS